MGIFHQAIEVQNASGGDSLIVEAMVDTGASYTVISAEVLLGLGYSPQEERTFELAAGRQVQYGLGWVPIRLDGRLHPTPVVFGESGAEPLLGAVTLEEFGLAVDPLKKRLIPANAYLVGIREVQP